MSIAALVRFTFREDALAEVPSVVEETLAATRTFDGLERLDILVDPERPGVWTLYEIWADRESEDAYRAFRMRPEGAMPRLGALFAEPPTLERFVVLE